MSRRRGEQGYRVEVSCPCYTVEGVKVSHVYLSWPDNPEKKERVWWEHWAGGRSVNGLPDGILPADLYYMTGDPEGTEAVIVEDERHAEAVEMAARSLRVIATVSGRKVPSERVLAHCLRGVSRVTLWPDNDEGGRGADRQRRCVYGPWRRSVGKGRCGSPSGREGPGATPGCGGVGTYTS